MPDQPTDHAGLETLPFHVCLRLLASVPVGRVGFYADGEVVLLPVNHAVDGQDVVFRTASGSKVKRLNRLNLHPWATSVEHPFWVRIHPSSVTGRRTPGATRSR